MEVSTTDVFDKGTYNLVGAENIPKTAAQDALGWLSTDDAIELCRGRKLKGSEYDSPDQGQVVYADTLAFGETDISPNKYIVAQTFIPVRSLLQGISLYKKADTGTFTGTVTISVQADSAGFPSGVNLVSKTLTNAQWLALALGNFDTLFSTGYSLTIGATYWLIITPSTNDIANHPNLGLNSAGGYANGEAKYFSTGGSWQSLVGQDIYFKTIVAPYGGNQGIKVAYRPDGTEVFFKKTGTSIQVWDGITWVDIIINLSATDIYTFTPYVSLAGNYMYIGGRGGLWKVPTANPFSPVDIYNAATNFKGKIRIDKSRMFLWDRESDLTGLYGSKIDPQDGSVYTTVTGEALGVGGSTTYSGTLAFKAGNPRRICFGVVISCGNETFNDNFNGRLVGTNGGTGTINYATGEYAITLSVAASAPVTADYQWEDSAVNGIADFTKSGTRVAGEGFIFRQDEGGDPIMNVLIQDGKYYSFKKRSIYEVSISADDTSATNTMYRINLGISSYGAAIESPIGIIFLNTANLDKPVLTTLQLTTSGSQLEPIVLCPQFDFSLFLWDMCWVETFGEYVVFSGRTPFSATNNRLFAFHTRLNITDILPYNINGMVKSNGFLYGGSSVNGSVSFLLNGFDDEGSVIDNFWQGRDELFETVDLKKVKRFRLQGKISKEQFAEVYWVYDNQAPELIGTIRGNQNYVDQKASFAIGTSGIGIAPIGGGYAETAYMFNFEIKLKRAPKFRARSVLIKALGIGWISINKMTDYDIRYFIGRMPKKYRLKQNTNLAGNLTNQ